MIITLDMGTTNTRFRLFKGDQIIDEKKLPIGAGASARNGGNKALKNEIRRRLKDFLDENRLRDHDIAYIAVSGMACSEHGLYNLPHLEAPVSFDDLCKNVKPIVLSEISSIPFLMIPGIKNRAANESLEDVDMMRGEETEFFGFQINKPCIAILPGSHTKLICFDGEKICSCVTGMGGELIRCISDGTIIKSDLPEHMPSEPDPEYLIKGFDCCEKLGFSKTVFKVRTADILLGIGQESLFSFFTGAVLSCELRAVEYTEGTEIIIGGSEPLRSAFALVTEHKFGIKPKVMENAERASAYGAASIARRYIMDRELVK